MENKDDAKTPDSGAPVEAVVMQFSYVNRETPAGYTCKGCGAFGVRLYRQYQTFADCVDLLCSACALKDQKQDAPDQVAESSIGWLVAAVPTEDGRTFWGYISVPKDGCDWWYALPKA